MAGAGSKGGRWAEPKDLKGAAKVWLCLLLFLQSTRCPFCSEMMPQIHFHEQLCIGMLCCKDYLLCFLLHSSTSQDVHTHLLGLLSNTKSGVETPAKKHRQKQS